MIRDIFANPIISGGAGLMLLGGLLATARSVPDKLFKWIKNRIFTTVEIGNTDPAFPWVKAWLASKGKCRYLSAGVQSDGTLNNPSDANAERPKFALCPLGLCTFRHHGHRLIGWLDKVEVQNSKEWRESVVLKAMAPPAFFLSVMEDAYDFATGRDGSTVQVWVPDGSWWRLQSKKPARRRETLILADGVESVIDRAREFLSQQKWYQDRGIPWRLGILLYGPPGTGKSSLAHVLASELRMNVNAAMVASFLTDDQLGQCLSKVPDKHVLLLEDVDAARQSKDGGGPSFSALLNALDGMTARDGQIVIMTTNHIENLDSAMTRPGRVDIKMFVGLANRDQAERMFLRFFPGRNHLAVAFADSWHGQNMAEIQKHLLAHRDCPEAAITHGTALAA